MKKILLTIGATALMLMANSQSTPRKMLLEHFTQASCGPCATYNPAVQSLINQANNVNRVVSIKYQTSWPGFDPMNLHNPTEVQDRVTLYSVSSVPNSVLDGNYYNGHPANWGQSQIDSRTAVLSPFTIDITHSISSSVDSVDVRMVIRASDVVSSGSYVAQIAIVEEQISFATAPGNNGETDFYQVMKKFLPNSTGTSLPSTWAVGDSIVINETWAMENVYDVTEIGVVAWVQKTSNDEVMQAEVSAPNFTPPASAVAADISATAAHTAPASLCSNLFTPEVMVTNNSSNLVDTFQVSYILNGGTPVVADIYTNLVGGGNYTHTFPQITLNAGANPIRYYSNTATDYSTYDIAQINNNSELDVIYVMPATAFDTKHDEGFESLSDFTTAPANSIAINPDDISAFVISDAAVGTGNDLGGFGNSTKSFFWDFFTISSGDESSVVWEKLDFSSHTNATLTFSHAYAQYSSENDRLKFSVSNDCGANWTDVFNKAGNALETANATTSRFWPTSNEWTSNVIDLSAFDGDAEVVIRMTGISAYGNSLMVDDINIFGSSCTSDPSNVVATPTSTTEVDLSWTENNSATEWTIEYGVAGFSVGTGTVVTATSNPYTLSGLDPKSDYDFYVSSYCKLGDASGNGNASATTLASIFSRVDNNISIYPNPASDVLNISIENLTINNVTIVNVLGETVISSSIQNGNISIDIEKLNSGIYFVNFLTNNGESISKKIVIK